MEEVMGCANTDRELWREAEDDAYAPRIHVTADGLIGINVGGTVILRTLREWHSAALSEQQKVALPKLMAPEEDYEYRYAQYLHLLIELQKVGHNVHNEIEVTLKKLHGIMFKETA